VEPMHELAHETWSGYFDAASKELRGAPVSIEIIAASDPPMIEEGRMTLKALAYNRRDDVFEIAAGRGRPGLPSVLRHLIDHPALVEVDTQTMLAPMTIAVEGRDGVRTVITVEREAKLTG
jgi:Family of unknown function (DUF5335)